MSLFTIKIIGGLAYILGVVVYFINYLVNDIYGRKKKKSRWVAADKMIVLAWIASYHYLRWTTHIVNRDLALKAAMGGFAVVFFIVMSYMFLRFKKSPFTRLSKTERVAYLLSSLLVMLGSALMFYSHLLLHLQRGYSPFQQADFIIPNLYFLMFLFFLFRFINWSDEEEIETGKPYKRLFPRLDEVGESRK